MTDDRATLQRSSEHLFRMSAAIMSKRVTVLSTDGCMMPSDVRYGLVYTKARDSHPSVIALNGYREDLPVHEDYNFHLRALRAPESLYVNIPVCT
jgi:hypothetical protein